jgi:uncharacterized protein YqeY
MGLKEQVSDDLKNAMRERDATRLGALRLLLTAMRNLEIARTDPKSPDYGKPVTEADLIRVVEKELKQRQDSIEAFRQGNRPDLAAKEQAEIDILQKYLPKQLSRAEIEAYVNDLIARTGKRDFRSIMPTAAQELRGKADGRLVNEVVKSLTS